MGGGSEEQAELGWGGAKGEQGPCVNLSSEARKNLQLLIYCQFYINIYLTSRLRDCVIYIHIWRPAGIRIFTPVHDVLLINKLDTYRSSTNQIHPFQTPIRRK